MLRRANICRLILAGSYGKPLVSHIDKLVVESPTCLQDLSVTVDHLHHFVIQDEEARMSSFFLSV